MRGLPGVFFDMNARDADAFGFSVFKADVDVTRSTDGFVKLRNLISLRKVGIKIVFARKHAALIDDAIQGKASARRELDRFLIQNRQRARKTS